MMDLKPEGKFTPITNHYGITRQMYVNQKIYVIWRHTNNIPTGCITGRVSRSLAVKECKYLEKLNADKFLKEKGETK